MSNKLEWQRKHRKENPEYYRKKGREDRRKRRLWLHSLKRGRPCIDCGGFFHPAALDWHHTKGKGEDGFQIGKMTKGKDKVLAEIDKCEIICANCHRIRHWKEGYPLRANDDYSTWVKERDRYADP